MSVLSLPAPTPPERRREDRNGRTAGVTVWTPDLIERLRVAYAAGVAVGSPMASVRAAFPGWSEGSLMAAKRRYVGGLSGEEIGPARPIDRAEVRRRLAAMPPEEIFAGVARLLHDVWEHR